MTAHCNIELLLRLERKRHAGRSCRQLRCNNSGVKKRCVYRQVLKRRSSCKKVFTLCRFAVKKKICRLLKQANIGALCALRRCGLPCGFKRVVVRWRKGSFDIFGRLRSRMSGKRRLRQTGACNYEGILGHNVKMWCNNVPGRL